MKITVGGSLGGERVDRAVALLTGLPRSEAAALVQAGAVCVGGRAVTTRSRRLAVGEELDVVVPPVADAAPRPEAGVEFTVVFVDDLVIVVDKPAGLVVHPGSGTPSGTLVNGLLSRFHDMAAQSWPDPHRPGIVHRLDKGTSGVLVVARTPAALAALAAQLRARSMERAYVALVWGHVEAAAGVIDAPLGRSVRDPLRMAVRVDGRRAVTRYDVLARYDRPAKLTLVSCRIETGRTHQIRVHLSAIGHPVVGDDRYDGGKALRARGASPAPVPGPRRPFLHAASLGFDHPLTGQRCSFQVPLAPDLEIVRAALTESSYLPKGVANPDAT